MKETRVDTQMGEPTPMANPEYRDRTALLIAFGLFEAALGGLALLIGALLIGLQFAAEVLTGEVAQDVRSIAGSTMFYGLSGVCLMALGIGSVMARRWARALNLTLSSMLLAIGIVSMIFLPVLFLTSGQNLQFEGQEEMPRGFVIGFLAATAIFMFGLYVVLPTAFILVYRSPHVKATCERKDPKIRWTDKCPLPVLAVSLLSVFGIISTVSTRIVANAFPFFGRMLVGFPADFLFFLTALGWAGISWGTYRLRPLAWWGCVLFVILGSSTSFVTYSLMDGEALYEAMGYSAEQIDEVRSAGALDLMNSPAFIGLIGAGGLLSLGYLLYVRRYFVAVDGTSGQPVA